MNDLRLSLVAQSTSSWYLAIDSFDNMSLPAGEKLGACEIVAPIGASGMGEVYRARDPRRGRDVAIKISIERFSERFEREARRARPL